MLIVNDIIAFIIEVTSLILLTIWVYSLFRVQWMKIASVILILTVIALIWGNFFAPSAKSALSGNIRWVLEFAILYFPYLRFIKEKPGLPIAAGIIIFLNLYIQARFGRSNL